jgi:hypothetical protein
VTTPLSPGSSPATAGGRERTGSGALLSLPTADPTPFDLQMDLFGRVGLVVADGADCRHRSYVLSHADLWAFLFRHAPTAAAAAAAGGKLAMLAAAVCPPSFPCSYFSLSLSLFLAC